MKKIISIILVAIICVLCVSCGEKNKVDIVDNVPQEDIESSMKTAELLYPSMNTSYRYIVYTTYIEITQCFLTSNTIIIPDTIENLPVRKIANDVFAKNPVKKLVISNNVVSIGNNCFSSCVYLTSVQLSNTLKTLGNAAFENCTSLTSVSIPASLIEIPSNCFVKCTSLKSVFVEKNKDAGALSVERKIGANAFGGCAALEHVWIPNDIEVIGDSAFNGVAYSMMIYGYTTSKAAEFCAAKRLNYTVLDDNTFKATVSNYSSGDNTPMYKSIGSTIDSPSISITLLKARVLDEFKGNTPPDGYKYLIADLEIKNNTITQLYVNGLAAECTVNNTKMVKTCFPSDETDVYTYNYIQSSSFTYSYVAFLIPSNATDIYVDFSGMSDFKYVMATFKFKA